ncbi:MAG: cyclopropane fatty acyl phospholipid synthase [Chlorobiaceae bacterium]|nr:cyclopropane fatty acyl phospholipid synthase [Chlorobiaceae bacterium]
MLDNIFMKSLERLLSDASVTIDGRKPWDIRVHDPRMYRKTMLQGNLGFGESYMDGWWDCDDLEGLFYRILSSNVDRRLVTLSGTAGRLVGAMFNLQTPSRAFTVGKRHYDAGNDLFRAMLDPMMIYSCAYWKGATSLDKAQEDKLMLVFDKLGLQPGMKVLDIGCGWGGAARFAAENYGAKVVGITVSKEQAELATRLCREHDVEIRLMDYRNLKGTFDRVYSLGMLEHVGHRNYRTFFETARRCLTPGGRLLVQTIGGNDPATDGDTWAKRYIFPNSMLPSASQIAPAYEPSFVLEDWHSFSHDYTLTLRAWRRNFRHRWPELKHAYDNRFYRMWDYYLQSFAGAFKARSIQLWQVLLTPSGIRGEYRAPHSPIASEAVRGRANGQAMPTRMPLPERGLPQGSPRSGAAPGS